MTILLSEKLKIKLKTTQKNKHEKVLKKQSDIKAEKRNEKS